MNTIEIIRDKKISGPHGTFGMLMFNGDMVAHTVEQPDNNNQKGKSCIPVGEYKLVIHNSKKYGDVVAFVNKDLGVVHWEQELKGKVGRSTCLIHAANYPHELQGCVAPVTSLIKNGTGKVIGGSSSKAALNTLRGLWGDRSNLQAIIRWNN